MPGAFGSLLALHGLNVQCACFRVSWIHSLTHVFGLFLAIDRDCGYGFGTPALVSGLAPSHPVVVLVALQLGLLFPCVVSGPLLDGHSPIGVTLPCLASLRAGVPGLSSVH